VIRPTVTLGDNITIKGQMTPQAAGMPITVYFDYGNNSESIVCFTLADGSFTASLSSNAMGTWNVQAVFYEDASTYGSMSQQLVANVEGPSLLAQYSIYIGLGVGAAAVASAVMMLYLKKWRGRVVEEEEW
jgi:ABC-type nitrate/sulfonate/bicarbonate transport system permease component